MRPNILPSFAVPLFHPYFLPRSYVLPTHAPADPLPQDLIFTEEAFERLPLDYDYAFSTMGFPACLRHRTGEIYKGNREFTESVGVEGCMMCDVSASFPLGLLALFYWFGVFLVFLGALFWVFEAGVVGGAGFDIDFTFGFKFAFVSSRYLPVSLPASLGSPCSFSRFFSFSAPGSGIRALYFGVFSFVLFSSLFPSLRLPFVWLGFVLLRRY